MSKIGKALFFVTVITSLALVVFPVAAQITKVDQGACGDLGIQCTGDEDTSSLLVTIRLIVNTLLILISIVAACYLVLGGVRYILSEGESDQVKKAKNTIVYAIIGLIVIGLSAMIVNFVLVQALGVPGSETGESPGGVSGDGSGFNPNPPVGGGIF